MEDEVEPEVFVREDFEIMSLSELFGFYAMVRLDEISNPKPEDYAKIYFRFELYKADSLLDSLLDFLVDQEINK